MLKRLAPINPPAGVRADALDLPENLFFANELDYSPVVQASTRAIDGSQHLFASVRKAGREVQLEGGGDAWISRADLKALQQWAAVPGLRLTLWWNDAHYTVVFDAGADGSAIKSQALVRYADIDDNCWHAQIVLKFLTVD